MGSCSCGCDCNQKKVKVGLVSCSGEEIPEGTIARIATRLVLEKLRPNESVAICFPLFIAGGDEERNFAKNYPTITIDGCEKFCAKKGTEKLSGKVCESIEVRSLLSSKGLEIPKDVKAWEIKAWDTQKLMKYAEVVAQSIAEKIDEISKDDGRKIK
ncbi:MAG: putative zinc-binding protein [Thermoplasmata archaeon]